MAETVSVQSNGSEMKLYVARPSGDAKGAVVVFQEAFGMTQHIMDVADNLASEGYLAVAPHLFHRSGDPIIPYEKMQDVIPHMVHMKKENLVPDIEASLDYLKSQGFSGKQVGTVGFCMGGTISLICGANYDLGASVTYYGGGITAPRFGFDNLVTLAPQLKTPWLGLYGDRDQSIPLTEVEVLRGKAKEASVPTEVHRYPDADHGFLCNHRPAYEEKAATDGWKRTVDWFDTYIKAA